jgi:uncharacterized protein (DUF1015 family)
MMRAKAVDVRPLRGVRFDPAEVGPIGRLLAPPYDVAPAASARPEFSIAEIENVDLGVPGDQHAVAAARYRDWLSRGILRRDSEPAIYLHEHEFSAHGTTVLRTALFALVRVEDWAERVVVPHERTMPGPRLERGARLRTTEANLSPLYFLYADPDGAVRRLIASRVIAAEPAMERDQVGGAHRLTPVSDPVFHAELADLLRIRRLFVADGHHRYEAALAYRDEARSRYGYDPEAPTEFVLAMLAVADDPGVIVLPTHRLLLAEGVARPLLLEVLNRWFAVERVHAEAPIDEGPTHVCQVVLGGDLGVWNVRTREGNPHAALLPHDKGGAFRSLPVAAVEGVIESIRGDAEPDPANGLGVACVIDRGAAIDRVLQGDAQAAFILPRPRLDRVMAVGEEGDLLPAKSTWFEPKAPAGLVINDLRGW